MFLSQLLYFVATLQPVLDPYPRNILFIKIQHNPPPLERLQLLQPNNKHTLTRVKDKQFSKVAIEVTPIYNLVTETCLASDWYFLDFQDPMF